MTIVDQMKEYGNVLQSGLDAVQDRMDRLEAKNAKAALFGNSTVEGSGPFLTKSQPLASHFKASSGDDYNAKNVRLGALVAALGDYGNVKDHLTQDEKTAFSSAIDPQGGLLMGEAMSGLFLDAVRPKSKLFAAGALTYPMEAAKVTIPGWKTPPVAGWRGSIGSLAESGGDFRKVVLEARDLGCYCDIDAAIFEDAADNLDAVAVIVERELSRAMAQALDLAGLTSTDQTGTGNQVPLGIARVEADGTIAGNYGIPVLDITGANGRAGTYDDLIDGAGAVYDANFEPNAIIYAPRTAADLAKLKGEDQYLAPPAYLADLARLQSNNIGTAYTKGSNTDTSFAVAGQFDRVVVGLRSGFQILRDPYTGGKERIIRLIVWQRADVAVLDAGALAIVDGIRPAGA
jgi:HK97 family phage major capsid protein